MVRIYIYIYTHIRISIERERVGDGEKNCFDSLLFSGGRRISRLIKHYNLFRGGGGNREYHLY